ncbi:MAG: EAL domain-containing protein [Chloroflexi bacterium]|nr:EAL domain-containing protein [Chloroflexota bacterium]MBV9895954.1 EAL domain-containing protein [Chloroflexota bacterium]
MRPLLRAYVGAVILAALAVVAWAQCRPAASSDWQPVLVVVLLVLCVVGEQVTFQIQSGWSTHAGTAPHMAAALLLPPGVAGAVAGLSVLIYEFRRGKPLGKAAFNSATTMLAATAASLVITLVGGSQILLESGIRGPIVAILACAVYDLISVLLIAGVVAIDQRRSFWRIVRGKIGRNTLVEIGFGLAGAAFAALLLAAPAFAPTLIFPAVILFLAKRAIERAATQARNLALTNTVGRAVAGTLSLDQAFEAITAIDVREALRLDGLALLPVSHESGFQPRVAAERDQPMLCAGLVERIAGGESRVHLVGPGAIPVGWIDVQNTGRAVAAAALGCAVGDAAARAALVAWRSASSVEAFTPGEVLLLETLADYAAVALETTRLFDEAVSGRKEAEEREGRIQAVMQNVADGLLTFDLEGLVTSANPAAERIFGRPALELVGQPIGALLPDLVGSLNRLASHGADAEHVVKREVSCVRVGGENLPVEVAITSVRQTDPTRFIAVVRDVSERRAFEEQLRHMAFHDPLTGLPNRALFMDRIEHALTVANGRGQAIGVLFIDLDNFKVVNDSLGHAIGDQLLVNIAGRLAECLKAGATLARFGGDEFTVLLNEVSNVDQPDAIAERLRLAMQSPFMVADRDVFASLSIGIAVSTPGVESASDLLRNADVAMYRAKSTGRGRAVVFDHGLDATAVERLELETDLRGALEQGELELHYQPIVDLDTIRVHGFEALIRWRHPRDGLVPPDRFISVAEESGLIIPIGHWVLETACWQLKSWHKRFGRADLSMSVNISARQFQQPSLVADVARVLELTQLPPHCLTIEITESLAMRDAAAAAAILTNLKLLGVGVAIDDFGTGYSSLSYLHRFPCDVLKIDRSFVSRLGRERQDHAIVEAIVALAHALDMEITAEGIETGEQLARLSALACERGQGYYFSRPLSANAAAELLDGRSKAGPEFLRDAA